MKAMILAAGKGTRLAPFTETRPKVLYPVGGYTLLEITILFLKKHGIDEFIINVYHHADQVEEYLEENNGFGLKYTISDEREELLNSGGGLLKARDFFTGEEDFVLTASDILTDLDLSAMIDKHRKSHALATLAVKERETSRSLLFDKGLQLVGWINHETGEVRGVGPDQAVHSLGFSTVHVVNTSLFNLVTEKGPFSITDLYLRLMNTQKIMGFRHEEGGWIEFGRIERISQTLRSSEFQRMIALI
ncbi:MAG: NTP transferase domain-containing protein [Bacteroidales bacterium]|nr:NTP transferase domain-containing protein [Bacteroidales bacterium]